MRGHLHSALHTVGLIPLVPLILKLRESAPRTEARSHPHSALHTVELIPLVPLILKLWESAPRTEVRRPPSLSLHTVGLIPLVPLTLRLPGISTTDRGHRHSALHTVGLVSLVSLTLRLRESAPRTEAGRPPPLLSLPSWVASPSRNFSHYEQPVWTSELSYIWDLKPPPFIPTPP